MIQSYGKKSLKYLANNKNSLIGNIETLVIGIAVAKRFYHWGSSSDCTSQDASWTLMLRRYDLMYMKYVVSGVSSIGEYTSTCLTVGVWKMEVSIRSMGSGIFCSDGDLCHVRHESPGWGESPRLHCLCDCVSSDCHGSVICSMLWTHVF